MNQNPQLALGRPVVSSKPFPRSPCDQESKADARAISSGTHRAITDGGQNDFYICRPLISSGWRWRIGVLLTINEELEASLTRYPLIKAATPEHYIACEKE